MPTPTEKPKRKRGRPPKDQSPINPETLVILNRLYLRGRPQTEIAKELGVSETTVRHHIAHSLRPLWKEGLQVDRDVLLAEIEDLKQEAWDRFNSEAPAETSEIVKSQLLENAKNLRIVEKATKSITRPGQSAWLDIVKFCITERAKLLGLYEQSDSENETVKKVVVEVVVTDRSEVEKVMSFERFTRAVAN